MFKLLKGGSCYLPDYAGKKDILVVYGTICRIDDYISVEQLWDVEVIDCKDKIICPGFIDQHVHITGGGGEEGPISRIPEIMLGEVLQAGVSTLVGVLGVDDMTRNMAGLLAKAHALDIEGITTYIYTGSYGIPTASLTGKPVSDIVYIDKVIGIGEVAISDHRSSHVGLKLLEELAHEARVGGLIAGKAGVMHIHVGDGKSGLTQLFQLIDDTDFPIDMFVPTHLNRNRQLFDQAVEYAYKGGFIDLTAGEKSDKGYSVPDAFIKLLEKKVNMEKVTVTSDGNGSTPAVNGSGTGVGKVNQLFADIKSCIRDKDINIEVALKTVTSNVAKILKLYPKKGCLRVGSDADILAINKSDFCIDSMLAKGEMCIKGGVLVKKGRYEIN